MRAKSFQASSIEAATNALNEACLDGFTPTLAFVFVGGNWDRAELRELFISKEIQIFGATTYGEFIDGSYQLDTVAVLLVDMRSDAFMVLHQEMELGTEFSAAEGLAQEATKWTSNPVFLVGTSHMRTIAEDVIAGIESVVGPEANIFGAMAAMNSDSTDTAVFTTEVDMDRGVVVLVVDGDKVAVSGVATCGWKPVGPVKTVTKSDGMWVHEIDGEPALDLMLKYSGACTREELTSEIWIDEFAMSLPPQLIREEGAAVMRPSLVYDETTSSVMCNGRVPEGSKIRFSLPPEEDVVDAVIDACLTMKDERAAEADALVYFSCAGRRLSMGPLLKREIDTVKALWNVPMAGFFSLGEISRVVGGRNELNNITSVCVVLKEK